MDNWFALYTKTNFEKKVTEGLLSNDIEAYCPTFKTLKQYSDRKKKVEKILLPNYVFVKLNSRDRDKVFSVNGVVRYVYWLGKPAKVRPVEIDQMKNYLNHLYDDFSLNQTKLNTNYKIKAGPFKGVSGSVVDIEKNRIRLELKDLGVIITLRKNKN